MKTFLFETEIVNYTEEAISIKHFDFPINSECFRLHYHDRIEFIRIKKGKMHIRLGTDHYVLCENELIIIPPKTQHRGYTLNETVYYDIIMFDIRNFYNQTDLSQKLLPAIYDGRVIFNTVISNKEIIACFDSIVNNDNILFDATSKIYRFLGLISQYEIKEYNTCVKESFSKQIISFFEKNYMHEITIQQLCDIYGYTKAHFCRKFKQETGVAPMTYLKILRLESAYKEIKKGKSSISTIALEHGFSDHNYFTRCFKAHFGFAPTKQGL